MLAQTNICRLFVLLDCPSHRHLLPIVPLYRSVFAPLSIGASFPFSWRRGPPNASRFTKARRVNCLASHGALFLCTLQFDPIGTLSALSALCALQESCDDVSRYFGQCLAQCTAATPHTFLTQVHRCYIGALIRVACVSYFRCVAGICARLAIGRGGLALPSISSNGNDELSPSPRLLTREPSPLKP